MTDTRTPVELVKEWIAALRSGKYKQTKGRLRDFRGKKFCCLGVLCNLVDPKNWRVDENLGEYRWDGSWSSLSDNFRNRVGIGFGELTHLTQLNDEQSKSFDEIADYIERVILPQAVAASETGFAPPVLP